MPEGMHTYSLSGAPYESPQAFDAWRLPRDQRTRRNRLDLRGLPSPVAPAQARPAVGGALRGDDQTVGRRGQNTDGRPGLPWDVSLSVPLVVLMCVQHLHAREMEAYRAENVVARVFIGCQDDPSPQIRDHSNMARAYVALGKEGVDEIKALILHVAKDGGFADPGILSSDTTAQELPIGYPNEPGILRGLAQRCGRALVKRKTRGR